MTSYNKEKNILDLEHSISLTKAGTFLALAFSSWFALFFGMKEFSYAPRFSALIASLVAFLFLIYSFAFFNTCHKIHQRIRSL